MSAPFFMGKVIDIIYTNPSEDFTDSLTSLCALLSGIFLCGAAANATRVYLMQTAGKNRSKSGTESNLVLFRVRIFNILKQILGNGQEMILESVAFFNQSKDKLIVQR